MNLTIVYSGVQGYENKLDEVAKIVSQTLSELDECEIDYIMLPSLSIPYYNGENADLVKTHADALKNSRGIIFAANAGKFAPNAPMINFIEHLSDEKYKGLLKNKSCLIAVTSDVGGERKASDVISSAIASLGGFDAGRILIGFSYLNDLEENEDLKEIIERQTEDYYRVIRQNRKFFIPHETVAYIDETLENRNEVMTKKTIEKTFGKVAKYKASDIYKKYDINSLDESQEEDINEITKFYAKKYRTNDNEDMLILKGEKPVDIDYSDLEPREKTCKQITQSLPHYFKPQYSDGADIVFQLIISAKDSSESFEGNLVISNNECAFVENKIENPDITIMSNEDDWLNIIKGKNTAQKSFMIGKIKVRGNFKHLTKMDQMFDFSMEVL